MSALESAGRVAGPVLLALATALLVDWLTRRRGLDPPALRVGGTAAAARRALALAVLAGVLWIGVFAPLGGVGVEAEIDFEGIATPQLFVLHLLFALALGVWYWLGFGGQVGGSGWTAQLGLRTPRPLDEIGLGLAAGVAGWFAVLSVMVGLALVIYFVGGPDQLPQEPAPMIPWLAGLPWLVRALISLSAGVFEEAFFRGFLQPRAGIGLSTLLFVIAHAGYEQPLMLVGITLLSLFFAALVRWRQNIWPAIAAHVVFDAVQLLVIVPTALRFLPERAELPLLLIGLW